MYACLLLAVLVLRFFARDARYEDAADAARSTTIESIRPDVAPAIPDTNVERLRPPAVSDVLGGKTARPGGPAADLGALELLLVAIAIYRHTALRLTLI